MPSSLVISNFMRSLALNLKVVTSHLLGIAEIRLAAGQGGWVPGLAPFQGMDAAKLTVRLGVRLDEYQFACLGQYQQQIADQQQLTVIVTAVTPFLLAGPRIEARQDTFVEPVDVVLIMNGAGELAAHLLVLPEGFDLPRAGCFRHPQHCTAGVVGRRDKNPVAVQYERLGDVDAVLGLPREAP